MSIRAPGWEEEVGASSPGESCLGQRRRQCSPIGWRWGVGEQKVGGHVEERRPRRMGEPPGRRRKCRYMEGKDPSQLNYTSIGMRRRLIGILHMGGDSD